MTPKSWYEHAKRAIHREQSSIPAFRAGYEAGFNDGTAHEATLQAQRPTLLQYERARIAQCEGTCGPCIDNGCKHHGPDNGLR